MEKDAKKPLSKVIRTGNPTESTFGAICQHNRTDRPVEGSVFAEQFERLTGLMLQK